MVAQKVHGLPFVHETKGAWAWINLGSVSLEPAELMKIAYVLVMARYLRFRSNYRTMSGLLTPVCDHAGAAGADPQAAGLGDGVALCADAVCDAVRRRCAACGTWGSSC